MSLNTVVHLLYIRCDPLSVSFSVTISAILVVTRLSNWKILCTARNVHITMDLGNSNNTLLQFLVSSREEEEVRNLFENVSQYTKSLLLTKVLYMCLKLV